MNKKQKPLFSNIIHTLRGELGLSLPTHLFDLASQLNFSWKHILPRIPHTSEGRHVAILHMACNFGKKYIGENVDSTGGSENGPLVRNARCFLKFKQSNDACIQQNTMLKYGLSSQDLTITLNFARERLEQLFWNVVESETSPLWFANGQEKLLPVRGFNYGPGTCNGIAGAHILDKVDNVYTVCKQEGVRYVNYLRNVHKPYRDLPFGAERAKIVNDQRVIFVPKDGDISRLITPQNPGDIIFQYPADSFLRMMLAGFDINLSEQQAINRELARDGSLYSNQDSCAHAYRRKMRPCTIDLQDASWIVGRELVKYLLPLPLYKYLDTFAPDFLTVSMGDFPDTFRIEGVDFVDGKATVHQAAMAAMGNAFCFPLQTLIFAAIVDAVNWRQGIDRSYLSVYGDDIICDKISYHKVLSTLCELSMKPNPNKCFGDTPFRESCGADWWNGYFVRPAFLSEKLVKSSEKNSSINKVIGWCTFHGIHLPKTLALLCEGHKIRYIPMDFDPSWGVRVPESYVNWKIKWDDPDDDSVGMLWDYNLQAYVYTGYCVKPTSLSKTICDGEYTHGAFVLYESLLPYLVGGIHQRFAKPRKGFTRRRLSDPIVDRDGVWPWDSELSLHKTYFRQHVFGSDGISCEARDSTPRDLFPRLSIDDSNKVVDDRHHFYVSIWDVPAQDFAGPSGSFGTYLSYYAMFLHIP